MNRDVALFYTSALAGQLLGSSTPVVGTVTHQNLQKTVQTWGPLKQDPTIKCSVCAEGLKPHLLSLGIPLLLFINLQ